MIIVRTGRKRQTRKCNTFVTFQWHTYSDTLCDCHLLWTSKILSAALLLLFVRTNITRVLSTFNQTTNQFPENLPLLYTDFIKYCNLLPLWHSGLYSGSQYKRPWLWLIVEKLTLKIPKKANQARSIWVGNCRLPNTSTFPSLKDIRKQTIYLHNSKI